MRNQPSYDVFLSHNSADKPAVEQIARRLRHDAGLRPFLDKWNLVPGEPWQEALETALQESETVAVFVGPSGISPWHNEELRAAIDTAVRTRDEYRVIPVLLPEGTPDTIPQFLNRRTWVDFRAGIDDSDAFERLVAGILGQPPEQESAFSLPDEPAPYRGLRYFDETNADFFFGRTVECQKLLTQTTHSSFTALVGASGSGKSSLVRAGLLPALDAGWHSMLFTPGSRPLRALADQIATLVPAARRLTFADALETRFTEQTDGLSTALSTLLTDRPSDETLLLIVDQFEELFTQTPDESTSTAHTFIANLIDAVRTHDGRVRVLITLRADFVDRCLDFTELRDLLEANQLLLGPMDEPALREAIVKPAQVVGAFLEKGLVGRLLDDVRGQSNALPLLQFTLAQLWQRRRGVWLTHAAYEGIGGVGGALDQIADRIYHDLEPEQRALARNIFLRLVTMTPNTAVTRRRIQRDELNLSATRSRDVESLLSILSQSDVRLVALDGQRVELTHEALISEWQRLRTWLADNQAGLRLHRDLTDAAQTWDAHNRDASYLYRGTRLDHTRSWATEHRQTLNVVENEFLDASTRALRRRQLLRVALVVPIAILLSTLVLAALLRIDLLEEKTGGWQQQATWLEMTEGVGLYGTALAADSTTPGRIYAADRSRGGFYRRDRAGGQWQNIANGALAEAVVRQIVVAGDGSVYVTTSAGIYRSSNAGRSWDSVSSPPTTSPLENNLWAIALAPATPQRLYVGIWHDGIWTRQDGSPWTRVSSVQEISGSHVVQALEVADDALYAATDVGLFRQTADGWTQVRTSAEAQPAAVLSLHADSEQNLLAGTRGEGIWKVEGQQLVRHPQMPDDTPKFVFSVSAARDSTYVGTSDTGVLRRRTWHWWQPGYWREEESAFDDDLIAQYKGTSEDAMAWVPAGEFIAGIDETTTLTYTNSFWIDRYETSWQKYCAQQPRPDLCTTLNVSDQTLPVTYTTQLEAQAYCMKHDKQLPTPLEWEKAARGPDGRRYSWGDTAPQPEDANLFVVVPNAVPSPNIPESELNSARVLPVNSQRRSDGVSPYGAYNMIGNVWEIIQYGLPDELYYRGASYTAAAKYAYVYFQPLPGMDDQEEDVGFRCILKGVET